MPILKFKPHVLQTLSTLGGYEDEKGDYHKGTSSWIDECKCDAVPAGKANIITLPDGTTHQYSYTLTLPKDARDFFFGEKVRVSLNGNSRKIEGTVKGFHRYQHQCKLWI